MTSTHKAIRSCPARFARRWRTIARKGHRRCSCGRTIPISRSASGPRSPKTPAGFKVRGRLSLGVQKASDARALARDGVLGLSIGYITVASSYVGKTRQLKQVDLYEISLTPMPANSQAVVTAAKSVIRPDTVRALENALHDLGFSIRESKAMAPAALAAIKRNDPSLELASLIEAAAQTFSLSKEKA